MQSTAPDIASAGAIFESLKITSMNEIIELSKYTFIIIVSIAAFSIGGATIIGLITKNDKPNKQL